MKRYDYGIQVARIDGKMPQDMLDWYTKGAEQDLYHQVARETGMAIDSLPDHFEARWSEWRSGDQRWVGDEESGHWETVPLDEAYMWRRHLTLTPKS